MLRRLRLRLLPNRPGFECGQLCQNMGARVHLLPLCLRLQTPLAGKPARFGRPRRAGGEVVAKHTRRGL